MSAVLQHELPSQNTIFIPEYHQFSSIFPLLTVSNYRLLKDDIRAFGLREPIYLFEDHILDGRGRHRACIQTNTTLVYREITHEPVEFLVKKNLYSRRLSATQKAALIPRVAEALMEEKIFFPKHPYCKTREGGEATYRACKLMHVPVKFYEQVKLVVARAPYLSEQFINGTLTLHEARQRIRLAEQETLDMQSRQLRNVVDIPGGIALWQGDFRVVGDKIPDNSVDLIMSDLPYHREHLPLWDELGVFAARVLKNGGYLLAYSGQVFLPEVLTALSAHLWYQWCMGEPHTGGNTAMWKLNIFNSWKPLLLFSKGRTQEREWMTDLFTQGKKGDKSVHAWSQGAACASYYIEKLSPVGGLVIDPTMGSGTFVKAARDLGRQAIGIELDVKHFQTAVQLLES